MPVQTFRDDDAGYEAWLTANPSGWVVNARRSPSPAYLKLHRARCATIRHSRRATAAGRPAEYIKVCADRRDELDAWAQRTFGTDLQDGCTCVQYGSRAQTARAERAPAVAATTAPAVPAVVDVEGYRTMQTPGLIPFEPRDASLEEARAALRSMLGGLHARPGELLHGLVEGSAVAGTDLDNALLYNVGGNVNAAARYGVALERRTAAPGAGTRYRYRLTSDTDVPCLDGEPVVALDGVSLGRAPRAWPDVWAAVRTSDAVEVQASAPGGEVGLRLRVGAPRFSGAANSQFVKTMVDGVMTALHAHGDGTTAAEIAERLATTIAPPADQISALLVSDERAALGVRQRLVVLRGPGVQCQPQDGRISALRIEIDRLASAWQLTGQIVRR